MSRSYHPLGWLQWALAWGTLLTATTPLIAHRLDEYLEATLLSLEPGQVAGSVRLAPGVAVAPAIIASIDGNRDGVLSALEQQAYAGQVLADLTLAIDGVRLTLHLVSVSFPAVEDMIAGTGEIQLRFTAEFPLRSGSRRLTFENRHQRALAVYLVNCLASRHPQIRLAAQTRDETQSSYELDFAEGLASPGND